MIKEEPAYTPQTLIYTSEDGTQRLTLTEWDGKITLDYLCKGEWVQQEFYFVSWESNDLIAELIKTARANRVKKQ